MRQKLGFVSEIRRVIWWKVVNFTAWKYRSFYKMDIGRGVIISNTAHLDKSINPKGIHIGNNTWILRNALILAHDYCRGTNWVAKKYDTYIGNNCVIGVNSLILPGINIGDHCVIAAGSVVTKDVPSHCLVAGNPAKVQKTGIEVGNNGQIQNYGQRVD